MTNPMIERVAKAIEDEIDRQAQDGPNSIHMGDHDGDEVLVDGTINLVEIAKAAIAAIDQALKEE